MPASKNKRSLGTSRDHPPQEFWNFGHLTPIAIVVAGVLIGAAVMLTNRYAVERADNYSVWLADRLTGRLWLCGVSSAQGNGCVRIPSEPSRTQNTSE
jgi:hypothetical protein